MYSNFTLFQNHLDYAKGLWQKIVIPGDVIIDATCGNGHDLVYLAHLALTPLSGWIIGIDIQQKAIDKTKELITQVLPAPLQNRIQLHLQSHETFPQTSTAPSLIVYNLGYLPGGEKSITTQFSSTLESIKNAQSLIKAGGVISITCYPGHPEGSIEERQILQYCSQQDPKLWNVTHQQWINRRSAPSLVILQKANSIGGK